MYGLKKKKIKKIDLFILNYYLTLVSAAVILLTPRNSSKKRKSDIRKMLNQTRQINALFTDINNFVIYSQIRRRLNEFLHLALPDFAYRYELLQ